MFALAITPRYVIDCEITYRNPLLCRALGITIVTFASLCGFLRFSLDACEVSLAEAAAPKRTTLIGDDIVESLCSSAPLRSLAQDEQSHRLFQTVHKKLSAAGLVFPVVFTISVVLDFEMKSSPLASFAPMYQEVPLSELFTLATLVAATQVVPEAAISVVGAVGLLIALLLCSKKALRKNESWKWLANSAVIAFLVFGAFVMDALKASSAEASAAKPPVSPIRSVSSAAEAFAAFLFIVRDVPTQYLSPIDILHLCLAFSMWFALLGSRIHARDLAKERRGGRRAATGPKPKKA